MSFTYVQSMVASTSFGSTISATFGSAVASGDLIVAGVDVGGFGSFPALTLSDTSSNTWTFLANCASFSASPLRRVYLYYAVAASGGSSFKVTASTGSTNVVLGITVADFTPSGTVSTDGSPATATGTGTALASGNITTAGSSDLVVAFGINVATGGTWTPGSGFTSPQTSPGSGSLAAFCLEYKVGVPAGTINPAMGYTTSGAWGIAAGAFSAAAATTVVVPIDVLGFGLSTSMMDTP